MNEATQGDKAASQSNWPVAITHYTNALIENPRAPSYYIKRATAYSRRKAVDGGPDLHAALGDVELALALARERGKRELIIDAQLRRAIVQAAMSAQKGSQQKLENELKIWKLKVKGKLSKLEAGDEKLAVSIKEYPDTKIPEEGQLRKRLKEQLSSSGAASVVDKTKESKLDVSGSTSAAPPFTAGPGATAASATAPAPSSAPVKIRHEWYQSQDTVVVTIYAKSVDKSKLETDLQDNSLSLEFPLPSGSTYSFNLDPLYAPIDTALSKVNVLSTKIEITLRKRTPGQKWGALEGSATAPIISDSANTITVNSTATVPTTQTPAQVNNNNVGGPSYPTSSRHGVKNWDKLAQDLTSKKKKDEKKKETKDADAEDDDDDAASVDSDIGSGDAVDSFFKKLYAGADPDTRRAMMKSFYESQGTALSTNWNEVGKEKVPVHPPSSD
uniref:Protein SGT1 like A n=1 Tax=Talaromyces marneffei PM1 TaxID=1077442 RepID=A0A093USN0_TALMA